jgi:subtilisin family serine protease
MFCKKMPILLRAQLLCLIVSAASAQSDSLSVPKNWFLLDPQQDKVQGVSAEITYQTLLNGQPSVPVIVAVIDSGVDIDHEDLKSVIWTNEDEIPGNGIDDDKNGYVDDMHGWNFIGGKNGNVKEDTYELTREYVRLSKKFADVDEKKVPRKQRSEYEDFKKIKDKFEKLKEKNEQQYELYKNLYVNVAMSVDTLQALLMPDSLTRESLADFKPTDPTLLFAKGLLTNIFDNMDDNNASITDLVGQLKEVYDHYRVIVEYGYNINFDSREIVGDRYEDFNEKYYGNADVKGPDAMHGTHVAGIIAADRKNEIGIKGIADNVKIMSVRAVPNGDERDKDVANAIRYAVDNGARIINMSFGKSYSPQKEVVDRAVKYAEQKNVLLIHAAGNDSKNIDEAKNYPSRTYLDGKQATNWIEVGASAPGLNGALVGSFSNYGKKNTDLFAPGVDIYSTVPGNEYKSESGTSMASPTTAGVAAVLMSYFPGLSLSEVKGILRNATRKFDGITIDKPGGGKGTLSDLSSTGGIINAYEAVKLAKEMQKSKLEKTR